MVLLFFFFKIRNKITILWCYFWAWVRQRTKNVLYLQYDLQRFLTKCFRFIYLDICSWRTKKQKNLINWGLSGQNSVYFPLPDLSRTLQKRLKRFNRPRCFEPFFRVKNFERASIICHAFEEIFQKCPKML